jgi:hypothetical protein
METGGYKGRTRELPGAELHRLDRGAFGIPASHIVSEYGMTELSSQAYDHIAGRAADPGSASIPVPALGPRAGGVA